MYKYRISKYNPKFRNDKGIYLKDDWTSYCDIGKKYEKIFTKENYLDVESKYCDVISEILGENRIEEMMLEDLECGFSVDEIKKMFEEYGLIFYEEEKKIIDSLTNNKKIKIVDIKLYIRLILRECFWCIFKDEITSARVEFGYDLYIYIYNINISESIIDKYRKREIFIEYLIS